MFKVCDICGNSFDASNTKAKRCSQVCKAEGRRRVKLKYLASEKGKAARRKYNNSEKGRLLRRSWALCNVAKNKESKRAYLKSKFRERVKASLRDGSNPTVVSINMLYLAGYGRLAIAKKLSLSSGYVGRVLKALDIIDISRQHSKGRGWTVRKNRRRSGQDFTLFQTRLIFKKFEGVCQFCGEQIFSEDWCVHHNLPIYLVPSLARSIDNGVLLHRKCHEGNYYELHYSNRIKTLAEGYLN